MLRRPRRPRARRVLGELSEGMLKGDGDLSIPAPIAQASPALIRLALRRTRRRISRTLSLPGILIILSPLGILSILGILSSLSLLSIFSIPKESALR